MLKTCLYDNGVLNIKDLMRDGLTDETIQTILQKAFSKRALNGWEAEKKANNLHPSMAAIGG
jgi:cyclic pyranopterin phosphate synthase